MAVESLSFIFSSLPEAPSKLVMASKKCSGEMPTFLSTSFAPRVKLADLLTVGDDLGEAATQLTAAILLGPARAEDLVARGALYARMNQSVEAEQDFREAIIRDVKHFTAYRYLGQTLVKRGLLGDGIRVLREAVSLAPQDPEALLYLGEALATQGQLDDALQALELASDLRPTDPRSFMLRGRIFDRLGRTEEAMEMHRKAREVQTA